MEYILIVMAVFVLIFLVSRSSEKRQLAQTDNATEQQAKSRHSSILNDEIISIVNPLNDAESVRRSYICVFALLTSERRTALINYYATNVVDDRLPEALGRSCML